MKHLKNVHEHFNRICMMSKKIILILSAVILTSCVTESRMYPRQYSLKNESNQNIKLKFYLTSSNQLSNEITVDANNTFNSGEIEFSRPHSIDPDYIVAVSEFSKGGDSLIVIYSDLKKSTFSIDFNGNFSAPIDRNIYRFGNYTDIGNDTFQFIFTENDYNNAEDCNGNCD